MSIKGLTDRGLAFPEIGQIRKGAEKNEKGYVGKDLTYFRVTFDEQEVKAAETFLRVYGPQPREINVLFPFDEIERVWDPWLEAYTAGRMVARADGEKYIYRVDPKTGEVLVKNGEPFTPYHEGEIVAEIINGNGNKEQIKCKATGRLKVVIPELQRLAYITVMTTSVYDIGNISAQLEAIKQVNGGRIVGIPLVLRRRPKKISIPKAGGQRARLTKYMLSIEADPEWVKAKLLEVKALALPGNGFALLPSTSEPHPEPQPEEHDHIEEGEFDDDEEDENIPSQPVMETAPVKPNTAEKPTRPYSPETVREGIAKKVTAKGTMAASEKQIGLLVSQLETCFAGDKDSSAKRHTITQYLTGKTSAKDLTGAEVSALLDWLKPTQDDGGAYTPNPMSVKEAQAILKQAYEDAGQMSLLDTAAELGAEISDQEMEG
jgi:hypothetical protein